MEIGKSVINEIKEHLVFEEEYFQIDAYEKSYHNNTSNRVFMYHLREIDNITDGFYYPLLLT